MVSMGQLSDKDRSDLNENKIEAVNILEETELLTSLTTSEMEEKAGDSVSKVNGPQIVVRYTLDELIEIGKKVECQQELNNKLIKAHKLSKNDKTEIRERTMSLNRNIHSNEARKHHINGGGIGIYRSKENNDHLILSQQFKSFNMGCHMPSMLHPNMAASGFNRDFSGRGRAGSGRILSRDVPWDYRPDDDGGTTNNNNAGGFNYRPAGGSSSNMMGFREPKREHHRDEKFYTREREIPYPYGYDQRYTRQYSSSYGDRYNNNFNSHGYDEEPEWFSAGPKSQHDVIELHGFEDDKNRSTHSVKSAKSGISCNDNNESSISDLHSELSKTNSNSQTSSHRSSTPTKKNDANNNEQVNNAYVDVDKAAADIPTRQDFNFEDFLKLDSISGLVAHDQFPKENQSSRFSKWFRQDGGQKIDEDNADVGAHRIPKVIDHASNKHLSASLLDLLQKNESVKSSKSSSIQSVEEVEARILQAKEFVPAKSASGPVHSNESLAFKKLLTQIQQHNNSVSVPSLFNPNIVSAAQNSNYFNAALLNQQPQLNGLNLMKILSEQQMQFNFQQQQFLQAQQSLLLKQQLQQQNVHPSVQQAQQHEIFKKLILLDQIQKQQNQINLSQHQQGNMGYPSSNGHQSHYRGNHYHHRKPQNSQSTDQIYMNRSQSMHHQPHHYLSQPAFTPTSVRRHMTATQMDNKLQSSCNAQTEQQQNNLLNNNVNNFNLAAANSDRINTYETNMTSGKNRDPETAAAAAAILHQPQLNAKPGRPILKGTTHHVQFAPTSYVQQ